MARRLCDSEAGLNLTSLRLVNPASAWGLGPRLLAIPMLRRAPGTVRSSVAVPEAPQLVWRARATGSPQDTSMEYDPGVSWVETRMRGSPLGKRLFSISLKEGEREQFSAGLSRGPGIPHQAARNSAAGCAADLSSSSCD